MTNLKEFLIILAILSSTSARHSRSRIRKIPKDLTQLFPNSGESDSNENKDEDSESEEIMVCETHHCRQLAHVFSEAMDKSVDPCVDFYKFTCGGWEAKNPIPKYDSTWSRIKLFESTLESHLRDELENEPTSKDILPIRQAKKWYRSCMDTKTRNTRGINPIASILMQTGGWPMVMDAEEWYEDQSWKQIEEYYMRLTGEYVFYDIRPRAYPSYNSPDVSGAIYIYTPDLPLDDVLPLKYRNYTGDDADIYRELIAGAAKLFIDKNKADVSDEQLMKDIDELIEFEKALYMAMNARKMNNMSIDIGNIDDIGEPEDEDLDSLTLWWENVTGILNYYSDSESERSEENKIDWRNIINALFDFANVKLDEDAEVHLGSRHFYLRLPKILQSTNKRTIVNYIHWKFVSHALRFTMDETKDILFDLMEHEYGVQERPPRWRECVQEMELHQAAAFLFVDNYFKESTAEAANKLTKNIKEELARQIDNSNWMTPEAKETAMIKLNGMKTLLGSPDWYKNRTAVVNHYRGLTIGDDYLDNVLSYKRYMMTMDIREYAGQLKKEESEWHIDPITINAVYDPQGNALNIPAVAFQVPLFGLQVPNYINYGITGSITGHEMSHGFDVNGIKYGINSTKHLWETDMMKMYYQQSKCFVKRFDDYFNGQTVPPKYAGYFLEDDMSGEMISENETITMGKVTAGENIADITGVQSVFNAYMKMRQNEAPDGEMKLPGFEDFSDEQMFFLSYAGAWCTVTTPEYEKRHEAEFDVHSPPSLRVFGAVSNSLAFEKAFNCPKDSPMNPKDKCDIWKKPGAALKLKSPLRKRHRYRHHFDVVD